MCYNNYEILQKRITKKLIPLLLNPPHKKQIKYSTQEVCNRIQVKDILESSFCNSEERVAEAQSVPLLSAYHLTCEKFSSRYFV